MNKRIFIIAILIAVIVFASASGVDMLLFRHRAGVTTLAPVEDYDQNVLKKETYFPDLIFTDDQYLSHQTQLIAFHEPSLDTNTDNGRIVYRVLRMDMSDPISIRVEIDPFTDSGVIYYKIRKSVMFGSTFIQKEIKLSRPQVLDTLKIMSDREFWSIPGADTGFDRYLSDEYKNMLYDGPSLLIEAQQNGCYHMVFRRMTVERSVLNIMVHFFNLADPGLLSGT